MSKSTKDREGIMIDNSPLPSAMPAAKMLAHLKGRRNAAEYHANMSDLRSGRITADEFRVANRALRERIGDKAHEAAKISAIAASNR